jgi:hypothetical protein
VKKKRFPYLERNILWDLYVIKKLKMIEILKTVGVNHAATVHEHLRFFKIPTRFKIRKFNDLTGKTFNSWEVLRKSDKNDSGVHYWCKCKCGQVKELSAYELTVIRVKWCVDCYLREKRGDGVIPIHYFRRIRDGAKKRGLEFTVNREYLDSILIKQEYKCILSGESLVVAETASKEGTASLDRIDSSKGYIEGNLQWVHKDVNAIKWNLKQSRFIDLCRKITECQNGNR